MFKLFMSILIIFVVKAGQFCNNGICQPCHYTCKVCTAQKIQNCLQCQPQYVLNSTNNKCISCGLNCKICQTVTRCDTCESGYFLSQATGKCNKCPIGAQLCTFSAIQQCKVGFYSDNGICINCSPNCQSCTSLTICNRCTPNYYINSNNQICQKCANKNCSTCSSDGITCLNCLSSYTGSQCNQTCPKNCIVCFGGNCLACSQTYYLANNSCKAASILCKSALTLTSCQQCILNAYFDSNKRCLPKLSINDINLQVMINGYNDNNVLLDNKTYLQKCLTFNLRYVFSEIGIIKITINITAVFQITMNFQIVMQNSKTNASTITIQSLSFIENSTVTIQPYIQEYSCPRQISLSNKIASAKLSQKFQPTIPLEIYYKMSMPFGISQIVYQLHSCRIQNCEKCTSALKCISCQGIYNLQNNKCVQQCSYGLYYSRQIKLCSIQCLKGYYPVLQQYACVKCISPCQFCKSQSLCISCIVGYYLEGDKCVKNCTSGFYPDTQDQSKGICVLCIYPCKGCIQARKCTSCIVGYLNQAQFKCYFICPPGYYNDFISFVCKNCILPCLQCSSVEICNRCSANFSNQNGICIQACPVDKTSINGICQKCQFPCKFCNILITNCTSCLEGYLQNNKCVQNCQNGFYQNSTNKLCMSCITPCHNCIDYFKCTSCVNNTYLYEFSCVNQCPNTTYLQNGTCQNCKPPCLTCTSALNCSSCTGTLFINYQNKCYLQCPYGTYLTSNRQCSQCKKQCLSCTSLTICTSCQTNFSLFLGECLSKCPQLTFSKNQLCLNCLFPCKNCLNQSECFDCTDGYFLFNNRCLFKCKIGYYQGLGVCQKCNIACSSCQNSTDICLYCAQNYYKNINGSCLVTCPATYYGENIDKQCKKCKIPCLQCSSSLFCLTCNKSSGYPYLFVNKCLSICPPHYYSINQKCQICSQFCFQCSNFSNCSSCYHGLFLENNQCVKQCSLQKYGQSGICIKCEIPCLKCHHTDGSYCLECIKELVLFDKKCYSNCPQRFYTSIVSNISSCLPCDVNCEQCTSTSTNCTKCRSLLYLNQFVCKSDCPNGTYKNNDTNVCSQCITPCKQCLNRIYCHSCINNLLLYEGSCISECPKTFYKNNQNCLKCQGKCNQCLNSTHCINCLKGYFVFSTMKCQDLCPSGYYQFLNQGLGQCLKCSPKCLQCYDSIACKTCNKSSLNPFLYGTSCVQQCPEQSYSNSQNFECYPCSKNCIKCVSSTQCTKCISSYLYNGSCISNCPQKTFQSDDYICEKCIQPCLNCYDQSNCQNCISNYYYYQTFCLKHCPDNLWTLVSQQLCIEQCPSKTFKLIQKKQCYNKCPKYYNARGQCVSSCEENQVLNNTLGCQICTTSNCTNLLKYKLVEVIQNGVLNLILIFSKQIQLDMFNQTDFQLIYYENKIYETQLTIQRIYRRNLQQISQYIQSTSIIYHSFQTIWIKLQTTQPQFSGKIEMTISNQLALQNNNYPVQNDKSNIQIVAYHQTQQNKYKILYYFGLTLSIICIVLSFLNLILDNFRSCIMSIEIYQSLYLMLYLQVWLHPINQNFLQGLQFLTMKTNILNNVSFTNRQWQSTTKQIIYTYDSNLFRNINFPLAIFLTVFVFIWISRIIFHNANLKKKHQIWWNHINDLFWIFGYPFMTAALSSLRVNQLENSYDIAEFVVALCIVVFFCILWLALAYQIIKNIFNGSFSERTFFWALKKNKTKNPLTNCHLLLILLRRAIIMIFISALPSESTSGIFLQLIITIMIISNIVINRPFKIYPFILPMVEILYGIILVLVGLYIVNIASMSLRAWQIYSIIIFSLIILLLLTYIWIMLLQTRKVFKKLKNNKIRNQQESNEQQSQQTSSNTVSVKEIFNFAINIPLNQKVQKSSEMKSNLLKQQSQKKQYIKQQQKSSAYDNWSDSNNSQFEKLPKFLIKQSKIRK